MLWNRNSSIKCSLVCVDDSHRCIAMKVEIGQMVLVCVNVYLPSFANTDFYEEDILNCCLYRFYLFTVC